MRILFLTQWFQPENFFKGLPFAKALAEKGHDVEVLTGFPNYPGGELYPGYRIRFYQKDVMDGVTVHRVPLYPSHDKSAFRRIANYVSFSLSALLMGIWLVKKPDVIYVYNLVTLGLPAFLIRFIYGSKVLFDVQDLWPESVAGSGMIGNKKALNFLTHLCNWVYRSADKLVVLSPGFKAHLTGRGINSGSIRVIYNWCDENSLRKKSSASAKEHKTSEKFIVLYAGAMGVVQGLDTLLKCADLCQKSLPNVEFALIGDGADRKRLEHLAAEMKLKNVLFLPRRPIEEMEKIYDMADALMVHLKDYPLFRITIPSKTQSYLFMGKPLIMAVRGDSAALVDNAGAGVLCEPDDPASLMEALKKLINAGPEARRKMGQAGHQYYLQNLSFDKGVDQFEALMSSLVQDASRRRNG
ncbi:MAG: glycosyltransferase family 4 protein [Fibrobacter sp.]|jgi:colanic acid biosynthesis glycosyl transferase WcaI|nr:glycosyltransferase family 4 protein [Fibrobacter sp.]